MIRLIRAPLAALLAFFEEWQPATTPRRTMQDAVDDLNAYEELNETLPESEPVTTSAGETVIPAEDMHPDAVYARLYVEQAKARAWSQSSPNPHGDLPSVPMPAGGSAAGVPPPPAAPSTSQLMTEAATHLEWYLDNREESLTAQINGRAFVRKLRERVGAQHTPK